MIPLIIHFHQTLAIDKQCADLFNSYVHPYDCCKYPLADTKKTSSDHCYRECFEIENDCCVYDCIYNEMKYFDNGKFTVAQRLAHYETDVYIGKEMKYQWEDVVKESVSTCENLGERI